jgi:hypothetical protein
MFSCAQAGGQLLFHLISRLYERAAEDSEAATAGIRQPFCRQSSPAAGPKRRARGSRQMPGVSLSDATLKAVRAHNSGATASEVLNYLTRKFGMSVRPNHLGMVLQRHRRAGRLNNRNQRWQLPPPA